MFRLRLSAVLLFVLLLVGSAAAQAANLPARAVVSYANLMTFELVAKLLPKHLEVDDLAFALIKHHVKKSVLAPVRADSMKLALTKGELPQKAFVLYLADVSNGTKLGTQNYKVALAQLSNANIPVPTADSKGMISEAALTKALTSPGDFVMTPDSSYSYAVSPTAPPTTTAR